MKVRKKMMTGFACMAAVFLFVGCQSRNTVVTVEDEEIKIPMILTVNPYTGNRNNEKIVNAFNREYEGIYEVEVEWVMETKEEYRNNLKRLNATDELPAIITDLRTLPALYQLMIENDRIEDLSPYLEEDKEWKDMVEPAILESCVEEDGKVYLMPLGSETFSCSGIFWNEELFSWAGIEEFPGTWDEFWECCDILSAHGIMPLSLYTEGDGWSAMLLATAEMADTQAGADFLEEVYPKSYNNDSVYHMAETLLKMFRYTQKDAVYSDYDEAYNNFIMGNAAMFPNDCLMIEEMADEIEGRIRFSAFPGNELISSPEASGWAVVSSYDEEVKAGAIEFLKFRSRQNMETMDRMFRQGETGRSRLIDDYLQAYGNEPRIVPNYQVKWNPILQEETLEEALPLFAQNKITPDTFIEMLDESVAEFMREQ